jgi:hypothetical protein
MARRQCIDNPRHLVQDRPVSIETTSVALTALVRKLQKLLAEGLASGPTEPMSPEDWAEMYAIARGDNRSSVDLEPTS